MNNTNSECYAEVWQEWFCGSHIATVERITVQILLILLFLIIIIGNVLTLVAIGVEKQLQTVFNIYIVNLAITDLLVAFSGIPLWLIMEFYGHWPFGKTTCAVLLSIDGAVSYVSNFTLVVMATDRYWATKWSLHYRNNHNKRKCLMLILLVW